MTPVKLRILKLAAIILVFLGAINLLKSFQNGGNSQYAIKINANSPSAETSRSTYAESRLSAVNKIHKIAGAVISDVTRQTVKSENNRDVEANVHGVTDSSDGTDHHSITKNNRDQNVNNNQDSCNTINSGDERRNNECPQPHWAASDYKQVKGNSAKDLLDMRTSLAYSWCDYYGIVNIQERYMQRPMFIRNQYTTEHRMVIDPVHSVSICATPKIGSTFIRAFVLDIILKAKVTKVRDTTLSDWNSTFKQSTTSVIVVRNPWVRLVSLYQEKVENFLTSDGKPPTPHTEQYSYMRESCRVADDVEFTTFQHFLYCVVKSYEEKWANTHWQPAVEGCDFCSHRFNYIVRLENMLAEASYIFEQSRMPDAKMRMMAVRNSTMRPTERVKPRPVTDYYRDIPGKILVILKQIYRYECLLFGYPDNPFDM